MPPETDLDDFLQKWRAAWPEWPLAQVFLPEAQHAVAEAWLALQLEWVEAAWGGEDPTPGFAKLAWWQDELRGWSKGARRHPLGRVLQRAPAPWATLADALEALRVARAQVREGALPAASAALMPAAAGIAGCDATLFADARASAHGPGVAEPIPDTASRWIACGLIAQHRLWHAAGSDDAEAMRRRAEVLASWPSGREGSRVQRIHAALVRGRLRASAAGAPLAPLSPLRTLWSAWRAARG